jgi:hypothetical protein
MQLFLWNRGKKLRVRINSFYRPGYKDNGMATSFERQAAALRQWAAHPQTDPDLARIMLETATDLENAGILSPEDEEKNRKLEQLFPPFAKKEDLGLPSASSASTLSG